MKSMISLVVLALAITSVGAQAKGKGGGPCKKIEKACKAAHHPKHKDCLDKILAGESVPGVTADAGDVEACKAKKHK